MRPEYQPGVGSRLLRYTEEQREVIVEYLDVLRGTRKTRKIAPSVLCKQLDYFARYPAELVVRACEIHMRRHASKPESYTRGILRGLARESEAAEPRARKEGAAARRGGYGRGRYASHYVRNLPVRDL